MVRYRLEEWVTSSFSRDWSHIVSGNFVEPQLATQAAHDILCYSRDFRTAAVFAIVREGRLDNGTVVARGPRRIGGPTAIDRAWTHVVAAASRQALPRILFYESASGAGAIYGVDRHGGMARITEENFQPGWTHVRSGFFHDEGYQFLFYNAATGRGMFFFFTKKDEFGSSITHLTWQRNWHDIVPGNFSNGRHDDLIFYNKREGFGEFYSTNGHGELRKISTRPNWRGSWRSVRAMPSQFVGKFDNLLFDQEGNGFTEIYATNGEGRISRLDVTFGSKWTGKAPNWRVILSGTFIGTFMGGLSDLCAYDPVAGTLSLFGVAVQA